MANLFSLSQHQTLINDERLPEPKAFWKYMFFLAETPRGSGNCTQIAQKILDLGKGWGYESIQDKVGNVIIRKPASAGLENRPMTALQGHMDLVAVGIEGLKHDFEKDPVICRIDESTEQEHSKFSLFASGTSLGADDGAGVAIMLAILEDKTLKHGPLECVFTVDEETTMVGASDMAPGTLKSKYLINIDSEEDWIITIGCAGGFEQSISIPVTRAKTEGVRVEIELKGMEGGHSGVEIHTGRGNANKILGRLVHEALIMAEIDTPILEAFCGGEKRNVIPNKCKCKVIVPAAKKDKFLESVNKKIEQIKREWKTIEPNMTFIINAGAAPESLEAFSAESSRRFLDGIIISPHGVQRMSPDVAGLVETSTNFWHAKLCPKCPEEALLEYFPRSSDNDFMPFMNQEYKALARSLGGKASDAGFPIPGWLPDTTNPLLLLAKKAYTELRGKEPEISAIHAGLECGMFQATHPGIKCISVGPYLKNVHSPKEELFIDTVKPIFDLILKILAEIE
ncbi:aminoacyl-histidine dipeptidase [Blattamonas nauphoetae]|uniref:Aminoacyl-histidine dipeptidase n=1 Tax=Blattamonas nauphoetae TaxID=2049346 RepID=A0ABQ9Y4Z8_9EUKA|nr:aminoacyl-histidine dipeptidase [Blattamonas nauphoetae]